MSAPPLWLFATVLVLGLSACVDAAAAPREMALGEAEYTEALHDQDTGAIQGKVLSEELTPVPARLRLGQDGLEAETDEQGRFVFSHLAPAVYDLLVEAEGYTARGVKVEALAGALTNVTFTLSAVPRDGDYYELFPFQGFEACQWYSFAGGAMATCSYPYTNAYGTARNNGANLSQQGLPKDIQDNRDRYNISVRPEHTGVVTESFWDASTAAAAVHVLVIACPWYDPIQDECMAPGETLPTRYFVERGTSPLRIEWKHPNPEHHKLTNWIMSRSNVWGDDTHPVGIAFEQKVEMYNTVFYGQPPPEGFSAGPKDF